MRVAITLTRTAALTGFACAVHGEDFGPLVRILEYGSGMAILLGILATAWIVRRTQRKRFWLLAPLLICACAVLLYYGFFYT
jgi:hypothetical protein